MNKEQAKQELHNLAFPKFDTIPEKLNLVDVLSIVEQINEPKKVVLTKAQAKFLESFSGQVTSESEALFHIARFGWEYGLMDGCGKCYSTDFDEYHRLANGLEDYEFKELMIRAIIDGYTVEEPLGVLLVDLPGESAWKYNFLDSKSFYGFSISYTDNYATVKDCAHKITESEAKEKYSNFRWVSLEELENE